MSELKTRDDFIELYKKERLSTEEFFTDWLTRTDRLAEWGDWVEKNRPEVCEDPRIFLDRSLDTIVKHWMSEILRALGLFFIPLKGGGKVESYMCKLNDPPKMVYRSTQTCHNVFKEQFENGITYIDLMEENLETLQRVL